MKRRSLTFVPLEHDEQVTVIKWCRDYARFRWPGLCLPNGDFAIYATPNGGERVKAVAARLKAEGVNSGVPDLHVPGLRLWVEMKRVKGSVTSQAQKDWHAYLRSIGDTVVVAKGAAEAIKAITIAAGGRVVHIKTCEDFERTFGAPDSVTIPKEVMRFLDGDPLSLSVVRVVGTPKKEPTK